MRNPISAFFGLLGRLFESGYEKIEDPSYALERAYRQQLQALEETRQGRIEVETIGARLDLELRQLGDGVGACEDQARRALLAGREDLARVSLGRREEIHEQLVRTRAERERLDEERRGLHQQETELAGAVQAFRSRKEVLKAQYGATRARLRVGEALTGYSQHRHDGRRGRPPLRGAAADAPGAWPGAGDRGDRPGRRQPDGAGLRRA